MPSRTRFLPPPARAWAGRVASKAVVSGRALRWLAAPPTAASHVEWTALVDAQEDARHPDSGELLELAMKASHRAQSVDLAEVERRCPDAARTLSLWPGEHYRFLAALVDILRPTLVVEIGTHTGMGSLSLASLLGKNGRVVTYDLLPWSSFPDTWLKESDFEVIEQRLDDLSDPEIFRHNEDLINAADLVFVDGPKDGRFEPILHRYFSRSVKPSAVVVYDDIRLLTMVELWRSFRIPKFDATSLAHWTGTGLVRYGT